ncbi:MAG: multifunctional 2',3'-cyclic-nucleotide 2'-phosphodiesterase/5'-nucleotidase/3'-nucleotidase [Candidatus Cloacimonadota bacterium]|nr:MAG: multifunctional 2',3'-cyclic-nucleotide 2'-phosphodiesterase/5'-nucleotidase/3'-nucleotidase [Candidatus Cloacimonadota bacterium]
MKYKIFLLILIISIPLFSEDLLLDIIFTNDIHGGIDKYEATFINPNFPPMLGGGGSAATYIKSVRKLSDGVKRDNLLIDAGDIFQGHPIGTVTKGRAIITYMNMIGYDLSVVGNHEYDIGEDSLKATYKLAKFPILSCNILKKGTDELVDYVKPYIIIEKMGIKIGIIGVTTTDTKKMSFPENIKNIDIISAKEALEKYIPVVRKQNVDLIFVAAHLGIPYDPEPQYNIRYGDRKKSNRKRYWGYDAQEIAHEVSGIDVIFAGHIHKGFAKPWEDPITHTLVFQDYAYGSGLGHVILKIDKETKSIAGYELPAIREGAMVTLFEDEFIPDKIIADTILVMQKKAEKGMDEIIGEAAIHISREGSGAQNLIGNLVCDAMLEETDADFSFINLGGVRDDLKRGPITYRDIFKVMPFDNQVVSFTCDGKFLKEIIEMRISGTHHGLRVAGVEVVYNRNRPDYDRITKLLIGGKPWKADKIYKVTTTDFLLQGNAGLSMLTKIPETQVTRYGTSLREVLVNYIRRHSPVTSAIDKRWKRDDTSEISPELLKELKKAEK